MSDRRFTEQEVEQILKYAAEAEHSDKNLVKASSGLTLAELNEIGREVGISAEAMRFAVRKIEKTDPETQKFLGFPIGVGKTVELDRKLTEDEWDRLVVDLRQIFNARGKIRNEGSFRSWSNGNLQVMLEPGERGQRLRMQTMNGNSRVWIGSGTAMILLSVVMTMIAAVKGGFGDPGYLAAMTVFPSVGAGLFGLGALGLPRWARIRRQQMDQIAEKTMDSSKLVTKGD